MAHVGKVRQRWHDLMWLASGEFGVTVWDGAFGRLHQRRCSRGHHRAMRDPRYRQIERSIGTDEQFLDHEGALDLWHEKTEIFDRINPPPWYLRGKWWWERNVWPLLARYRAMRIS